MGKFMRLHTLKINGFKRINDAEVKFGDATFLIGSNNAGKSSVLKAIEWLLSNKKTMDLDCFCSEIDQETGENKVCCKTVILEAEFRNVPESAKNWRVSKEEFSIMIQKTLMRLEKALLIGKVTLWERMQL